MAGMYRSHALGLGRGLTFGSSVSRPGHSPNGKRSGKCEVPHTASTGKQGLVPGKELLHRAWGVGACGRCFRDALQGLPDLSPCKPQPKDHRPVPGKKPHIPQDLPKIAKLTYRACRGQLIGDVVEGDPVLLRGTGQLVGLRVLGCGPALQRARTSKKPLQASKGKVHYTPVEAATLNSSSPKHSKVSSATAVRAT